MKIYHLLSVKGKDYDTLSASPDYRTDVGTLRGTMVRVTATATRGMLLKSFEKALAKKLQIPDDEYVILESSCALCKKIKELKIKKVKGKVTLTGCFKYFPIKYVKITS